MKETKIIFRDDDVGDHNERFMMLLENIFIPKNVPLSLAIIPQRLEFSSNAQLIEYLRRIKNNHSNNIEFHQHGYNHQISPQFECKLDYSEQHKRLCKGQELLNNCLGVQNVAPVFTPPSHRYNLDTIDILKKLNFKFIFRYSKQTLGQHKAPDFNENYLTSLFAYFDPVKSYEDHTILDESSMIIRINQALGINDGYLIVHLHHQCINEQNMYIIGNIIEYLKPIGNFYTVMQAFPEM